MGPSYKVILSGIYYNLHKVAKLVDFIDVIITYYIGTLYCFFLPEKYKFIDSW